MEDKIPINSVASRLQLRAESYDLLAVISPHLHCFSTWDLAAKDVDKGCAEFVPKSREHMHCKDTRAYANTL